MTQIIDSLNWRYATKTFDASKKLTDEQVNTLIEATILSASSFGLQPWKIIVVKDAGLREQIKNNAWGQTQITDASHLLVLAVNKNVNDTYVDNFIDLVSTTRVVDKVNLEGYSQMMKGTINGKSQVGASAVTEWSIRQVYIALGTLLAAAATEKIDSCPMEGFNNKKADEILGLESLGLESVLLCPIGYRSETDQTASYKKVRFPKDQIVIEK